MSTHATATVPCPWCNGTGRRPDWRILGAKVRAARKRKRLGLRDLARQAGCSAAYLSDLEYGRRAWQGPKAGRVLAIVGVAA